MKYRIKAHAGAWAVVTTTKTGDEVVESGMTRPDAKTLAYRMNAGRVSPTTRHPLAMVPTGVPGHVVGKLIDVAKAEAAYNFQKNKFAILAGIRESERLDALPAPKHISI